MVHESLLLGSENNAARRNDDGMARDFRILDRRLNGNRHDGVDAHGALERPPGPDEMQQRAAPSAPMTAGVRAGRVTARLGHTVGSRSGAVG